MSVRLFVCLCVCVFVRLYGSVVVCGCVAVWFLVVRLRVCVFVCVFVYLSLCVFV